MSHKPVKKVLQRLRKMQDWERYMILDWLKDWHSYKEEEE
jgi:hypothetical protein